MGKQSKFSPVRWSVELDRILIDGYAQGDEAAAGAINRVLDEQRSNGHPTLSRTEVLKHARDLRLAEKQAREQWSDAQECMLVWMIGDHRARKIARMVGRSEAAVRSKLWRMQRSSRLTRGYSIKQVCNDYGMGFRTVMRFIDERVLELKDGRIVADSYLKFCLLQKERGRLPLSGSVAEKLLQDPEGVEDQADVQTYVGAKRNA